MAVVKGKRGLTDDVDVDVTVETEVKDDPDINPPPKKRRKIANNDEKKCCYKSH